MLNPASSLPASTGENLQPRGDQRVERRRQAHRLVEMNPEQDVIGIVYARAIKQVEAAYADLQARRHQRARYQGNWRSRAENNQNALARAKAMIATIIRDGYDKPDSGSDHTPCRARSKPITRSRPRRTLRRAVSLTRCSLQDRSRTSTTYSAASSAARKKGVAEDAQKELEAAQWRELRARTKRQTTKRTDRMNGYGRPPSAAGERLLDHFRRRRRGLVQMRRCEGARTLAYPGKFPPRA